MELSNKNNAIKKMREFFISEKFMLIQFVVAMLITVFRVEAIGVCFFTLLVSFLLLFCDDLLTTTLPFLLLTETVIKCYDSFDVFVKYVWLAFPLVIALVFHFAFYKHKIRAGKYIYALLVVSLSIALGGVGFISKAEYFSWVSFYYVFGLGFGMAIIYVLIYSYIDIDKDYSTKDKITNIMLFVGMLGVFMVITHYIMNIGEVIEQKSILYLQWRNNMSTFFILAMPFPIIKAVKKPSYICLPFLYYGCILLTGSRGGLLFGGIELLLTLALLICLDRKHRLTFIGFSIGLMVLAVLLLINFYPIFRPTFLRLLNALIESDSEERSPLYRRAITDFLNRPIFGTGIAYMGNRDVHNNAKFALCWYHCEPLQIIGSLGLFGVLAYGYQLIERLHILLKPKSLFSIVVMIAYIGLELMSLVNPGVFCPLPYLFLITFFIAIVEKYKDSKKEASVKIKVDKSIEKIDEELMEIK